MFIILEIMKLACFFTTGVLVWLSIQSNAQASLIFWTKRTLRAVPALLSKNNENLKPCGPQIRVKFSTPQALTC